MGELDQIYVVLRKVLEECCPPVHLSVLLRAYRIERGEEMPFEEHGYIHPSDFLREHFPELTLVRCDKNFGGYIVHLKDQADEFLENPSEEANSSLKNLLPPSHPALSPVKTVANCSPPQTWSRKKPVPVQFKVFLAGILDNFPMGILARDFVEVFYKASGSALSYKLYGYPGHLSMFKDLSDVFRIEQQADNDYKLFPLEKSDSKMSIDYEPRTSFDLRIPITNGREMNRSPPPSSSHPTTTVSMDTSTIASPVRRWHTPQGALITVTLDGVTLVPTGCLATMVGLNNVDILLRLKLQGIDVRGLKFLSNDIPDHMVLLQKLLQCKCPSLISEDGRPVGAISLVPFESCGFILSAFSRMSSRIQMQTEAIKKILATLEAS